MLAITLNQNKIICLHYTTFYKRNKGFLFFFIIFHFQIVWWHKPNISVFHIINPTQQHVNKMKLWYMGVSYEGRIGTWSPYRWNIVKPVIKILCFPGCGHLYSWIWVELFFYYFEFNSEFLNAAYTMLCRNWGTSKDPLLKELKTENAGSKIQLTVQSLVSLVAATERLINCLRYL